MTCGRDPLASLQKQVVAVVVEFVERCAHICMSPLSHLPS